MHLQLDPSIWPDPTSLPAAAAPAPAAVACSSHRTIVIHLAGAPRIRSARVTVAGRAVRVRLVGRTGVRVSLRSRPRGVFTVRVVARTSHGVRRTTRRYRTCTPGGH